MNLSDTVFIETTKCKIQSWLKAAQEGGRPGGGGGFQGGGFHQGQDPFDIFNSIFKEFGQQGRGGGQGGFGGFNFAEQMRNQPKVQFWSWAIAVFRRYRVL